MSGGESGDPEATGSPTASADPVGDPLASSLLGLEDDVAAEEPVVAGWSPPEPPVAAAPEPEIDLADASLTDVANAAAADAVAEADPGEPGMGESGPGESDADSLTFGSTDDLDVEALVLTLEAVTAERDSHLADLQRVNADFSNFRKQATRRQSDTIASAGSGVAEKLLPILDACEAALAQGADDVQPIFSALSDTLVKEGLERLDEPNVAFDPLMHEAVMHEPGEGEPTVAEVLRTGYLWNGKVIRPAMVKVEG